MKSVLELFKSCKILSAAVTNLVFMLVLISNLSSASTVSDSIRVRRFIKHVQSLEQVIRQSDNEIQFLDMSDEYSRAILEIDSGNDLAKKYLESNSLIRSTCSQNLNHKIPLYSCLNRIPDWMGFADDPVEYALDNSLSDLLRGTYFRLYNGVLGDANITSVVIKDNSSDDIHEIATQTLVKASNNYILPSYMVSDILGKDKTERLLVGDFTKEDLSELCTGLKLDQLGLFFIKELDVIDNELWIVESRFQLYNEVDGLNESIASIGFSIDERSVSMKFILPSIAFSLLVLVALSLLVKNISMGGRSQWMNLREQLGYFRRHIGFVLACFPIPLLTSALILLIFMSWAPDSTEHYLEISSLAWVALLVLSLSVAPILLNLLFIIRLNLDGFHTIGGYRSFSIVSILSSFYIFVLISYIKNIDFDYTLNWIILFFSIVLGDFIAKLYYRYSETSNSSQQKKLAVSGLLLSFFFLVISNWLFITSHAPIECLMWCVTFAFTSLVYYFLLRHKVNSAKPYDSNSHELESIHEVPFVTTVIDVKTALFEEVRRLSSDSELSIMLISGKAGIGKTRALNEVKKYFTSAGWDWYYGDCDEIQNDSVLSFEPFLEAFKDLLGVDEFSDRGERLDLFAGAALEIGASLLSSDAPALIKNSTRKGTERMTETCVEIIDRLEKKGERLVFVMEDIQWIDPESYVFLKLFIQVINRNRFARSRATIILTVREDDFGTYRGPDIGSLKRDLEDLQRKTSHKYLIHHLLSSADFILDDFLIELDRKQMNKTIHSTALHAMNELFNQSITDLSITPKYIFNSLENWRRIGVLQDSENGLKLKRQISAEDLSSETSADTYYHQIISQYDDKWARLLESAAIIGYRFDASVLAKVWGYELLEVLGFLERAVKDRLVIDVSDDDNIFVFGEQNVSGSAKRVMLAIRSYYQADNSDGTGKQISLEYNKRFITLNEASIRNLSERSTNELLFYTKRLCLLFNNQYYRELLEDLILEIVIRLVSQELFEKLNSVVTTLKEHKELSNVCEVIECLPSVVYGSSLEQINLDKFAHIERTSLVHDLLLLANLLEIDNGERTLKLTQDQIQYIEEELVCRFSSDSAIYIITLLASGKYPESDFTSKIEFIKSFAKKANLSIRGEYIQSFRIMQIRYLQSRIIPGNIKLLGQDSVELFNKVRSNEQLDFLKVNVFSLRLKIVSYVLNDDDLAISEFREEIKKNFDNGDYNWLRVALSFLSFYFSDVYFKRYQKEAEELLVRCESIVYKYHDENTWTKTIDQLLSAKCLFELSRGGYDKALSYSKRNLELMHLNNQNKSTSYRTACKNMAKVYEAMGDGQNAIHKKLESIGILKLKIEEIGDDETLVKELSIEYNNISHVYRNHLADLENALKYAKLALALKTSAEGKAYGISLYSVGRAYDAMDRHKDALAYYRKAEPYFTGELPRDIYEKNVLNLNSSLAAIRLKEENSDILLENAVKSLEAKEFAAYLTAAIRKRMSLAKSILSK